MAELMYHKTVHGTALGREMAMNELREWRPSISGIRDTILGWHVVGVTGLGNEQADNASHSQYEVEATAEMARDAVTKGRVIDFGHLPNEVIKDGSNRGGKMYAAGGLPQPFREPWIAVHSWNGPGPDGKDHTAVAVYVVRPLDPEVAASDVEITALDAMSTGQENMLFIGDNATLLANSVPVDKQYSYDCLVKPAPWRYMAGMEGMSQTNKTIEMSAASNVLDPFATMMLMLHAVGVKRETITPSEKLANARRKSGKPPIPPYDRVFGEQYVTLLLARRSRERAEPGGGTHASPIPHIRLGHMRTYRDGTSIPIHDTLVNVAPEARASFVSSRSHYVIPERK